MSASLVRKYFWLGLIAFGACNARATNASSDEGASDTTITAATSDGAGANGARPDASVTAAIASSNAIVMDAGAVIDGPVAYATASPAPIFNAMEWPAHDPTKAEDDRRGVVRLGYLRKGQAVAIVGEPENKPNCTEGWYTLAQGGFICGKFMTRDANDKALKSAPHPPFTDGPLPYQYGLNLTNGAPLYRRPPLRAERKEYERGLVVGKHHHKDKDGDDTSAASASGNAGGGGETPAPAGSETPWYLQDHHGQRPQVTLGELKGESTLIETRMVRGFYLALDQEIGAFSGKFWRTTTGQFAPIDHVLVHKSTTEFEGVWVGRDEEKRKLPIAWILGKHARKWFLEDGKNPRHGDPLDRFTIVQLTGQKKEIDGRGFFETDQGYWMRDLEGTVAHTTKPPADLKPNEKWIDVNLRAQTLVAYEGEKPVFATIISSGRHNDEDKAKDHRTVQGDFRIREKHIAATMEDDSASDGAYSIQDVPWIMYFKGSYALHGAFWHSNFGHEKSHGCVNMTPHDAKELFGWVGPTLPAGWHGVFATAENSGTRVIVHE